MTRLQRLTIPATLLALLLAVHPAQAASFTENFEGWAWSSTPAVPTGYCAFGSACFQVMGCGNNQSMFIRRNNGAGICDYDHQVRHWTGGETLYHGNDPAVSGTKVAVHALSQQTGNTAELMTSRALQASIYGSMQADFYVHGDGITGDEHYGVLSHLQLSEIPGCARDCSGVAATATTTNATLGFYGAIFGNFANGTGFAIEKACPNPAHADGVVAGTFKPYADAFGRIPGNSWYRLVIGRFALAFGEPFFYYQAYRRVNGSWVEIANVSVPMSQMLCGGTGLSPGYLGLFGVRLSGAASSTHLDWDNVSVSW